MAGDAEFSVYQFFSDNMGTERVRSFVTAEEAVKAFEHYTNNVATMLGMVEKVMITDGGDFCVYLWEKGKGVTCDGLGEKRDA
jgi:hypothetical protein